MKILITGANGLLGSNLCLIYSENKNNTIYATSKELTNIPNCQNYKFDITNKEDFVLLEKLKLDIIIHCAALTNVDYCEEHPKETEEIISLSSKNIAEFANRIGSYLIHISTDAVFDGNKGNYTEGDKPDPINVYGKTKLNAEQYIQKIYEKSNNNYSIIRTNIYGCNRKNKESLAEWMLHKLERKEKLSGIKDVFFTPILVNNLSEALLELYKLKYKGIIHIAGSENCSKLEFAYKIAKVFKLNKNLIEPISVDSLNFKARRSKNMTLNTQKAQTLLKTKLLNVEEGLIKFKELIEENYPLKLKEKNEI